jgi:hypothetical protein
MFYIRGWLCLIKIHPKLLSIIVKWVICKNDPSQRNCDSSSKWGEKDNQYCFDKTK